MSIVMEMDKCWGVGSCFLRHLLNRSLVRRCGMFGGGSILLLLLLSSFALGDIKEAIGKRC
jgi:hypothetical protein